MTENNILVAGGAGFVGSHLCESLIKDGENVYCVDNLGSGNLQNISHLMDDPAFSLIEADIRKKNDFPAVDEIYHLASRASPDEFTKYPVRIALTNTKGTRMLLDHAVDCDAKMLFASTSEVYGDPEIHPQPESYRGSVNIRGKRGCYDEAKRFGETLAVAYEREYDLDVRTVRIFNTYGPRMRPNDGRVIPTFLSQVNDGKNLTVYGDGSQTRSFCYIDDLVSGIRKLMDTKGLQGEVVNIGNPDEISIQGLAEKIISMFDSTSDISYEPLPEDDPQRRKPDITKAKELLDWQPTISLDEGLPQTLEFYKQDSDQV